MDRNVGGGMGYLQEWTRKVVGQAFKTDKKISKLLYLLLNLILRQTVFVMLCVVPLALVSIPLVCYCKKMSILSIFYSSIVLAHNYRE